MMYVSLELNHTHCTLIPEPWHTNSAATGLKTANQNTLTLLRHLMKNQNTVIASFHTKMEHQNYLKIISKMTNNSKRNLHNLKPVLDYQRSLLFLANSGFHHQFLLSQLRSRSKLLSYTYESISKEEEMHKLFSRYLEKKNQYLLQLSKFCQYIHCHTKETAGFCLLDKDNHSAALFCFVLTA